MGLTEDDTGRRDGDERVGGERESSLGGLIDGERDVIKGYCHDRLTKTRETAILKLQVMITSISFTYQPITHIPESEKGNNIHALTQHQHDC